MNIFKSSLSILLTVASAKMWRRLILNLCFAIISPCSFLFIFFFSQKVMEILAGICGRELKTFTRMQIWFIEILAINEYFGKDSNAVGLFLVYNCSCTLNLEMTNLQKATTVSCSLIVMFLKQVLLYNVTFIPLELFNDCKTKNLKYIPEITWTYLVIEFFHIVMDRVNAADKYHKKTSEFVKVLENRRKSRIAVVERYLSNFQIEYETMKYIVFLLRKELLELNPNTGSNQSNPFLKEKFDLAKLSMESTMNVQRMLIDLVISDLSQKDFFMVKNKKTQFKPALKNLVKMLSHMFGENKEGIEISVQGNYNESKLPSMIMCDMSHIFSLAVNLLSNAVKYTTKGTVRGVVSFDEKQNLFKFEVVDDGPGISKKFEIGQNLEINNKVTLDHSPKFGKLNKNVYSSGFGLKISKMVIKKLLNGKLVVKKRTDGKQGTIAFFTCLISVVKDEEEQKVIPESITREQRENMRMVIVDVDEMRRKYCKFYMYELGYLKENTFSFGNVVECSKGLENSIVQKERFPTILVTWAERSGNVEGYRKIKKKYGDKIMMFVISLYKEKRLYDVFDHVLNENNPEKGFYSVVNDLENEGLNEKLSTEDGVKEKRKNFYKIFMDNMENVSMQDINKFSRQKAILAELLVMFCVGCFFNTNGSYSLNHAIVTLVFELFWFFFERKCPDYASKFVGPFTAVRHHTILIIWAFIIGKKRITCIWPFLSFGLLVESPVFFQSISAVCKYCGITIFVGIIYRLPIFTTQYVSDLVVENFCKSVTFIVTFYTLFAAIVVVQKNGKKEKVMKKIEAESKTKDINLQSCMNFITHEISNILNGWRFFAEEMKSTSKKITAIKEYVTDLEGCISSLEYHCFAIAEYNRISKNTFKIVNKKLTLLPFIKNIINRQRRVHGGNRKNIKFSELLDIPKDLVIECDEKRLYHLINNLVSNALRMTKSGEINIIIQMLKNCELKIVVINTAPDFHDNDARTFFNLDPFTERKEKYRSHGFSLFVNKVFVEKLGGSIKYQFFRNMFDNSILVVAMVPVKYCEGKNVDKEEIDLKLINEKEEMKGKFDEPNFRLVLVDDSSIVQAAFLQVCRSSFPKVNCSVYDKPEDVLSLSKEEKMGIRGIICDKNFGGTSKISCGVFAQKMKESNGNVKIMLFSGDITFEKKGMEAFDFFVTKGASWVESIKMILSH